MFSGIKFVPIDGFMTTINACFYLNVPYNIPLAVRHWLGDDLRPSNIFPYDLPTLNLSDWNELRQQMPYAREFLLANACLR